MRVKLADFGAHPNSSEDSRPALTAALAALAASSDPVRVLDGEGATYSIGSYEHPNRVVQFPLIPKLRVIDAQFNIDAWTDTSCRAFVFDQGLDWASFEGVRMNYTRSGPSTEKQSHAIFVYGGTDTRGLVLEECEIYAAGGDAVYMGAAHNGSDGLIVRGLRGQGRRNLICMAGDDWTDGVRDLFDIDRAEVVDMGLNLSQPYTAVWFERGKSSSGHPDRFTNVRVRRTTGGVIGVANCDALVEQCEAPKVVVTSMVGKIRGCRIYGWPSPGGIGDGNGWCIDGRGGDRLDVDIDDCDFEVPEGGSGVISCRPMKYALQSGDRAGEWARPAITVSRSRVRRFDPSTQTLNHPALLQASFIACDID